MLGLLTSIVFGFFIYLGFAVFAITIGILIVMSLKDAQRKKEEDEGSDT